MKVGRNKRFGFNLVRRRVSLRSLAEGVMLAAQRQKAVIKGPECESNGKWPGSNLTHFGLKFLASCPLPNALTFI